MERDASLENLLALNGEVHEVGAGFWAKYVVRLVPPSVERPHGIQYSLTLHRPNGDRIVGYDNAHSLTQRSGVRSWRTSRLDHRHRRGRVEPYEFRDAAALLEDFWKDVEDILRGEEMEP